MCGPDQSWQSVTQVGHHRGPDTRPQLVHETLDRRGPRSSVLAHCAAGVGRAEKEKEKKTPRNANLLFLHSISDVLYEHARAARYFSSCSPPSPSPHPSKNGRIRFANGAFCGKSRPANKYSLAHSTKKTQDESWGSFLSRASPLTYMSTTYLVV